MKYVISNEQRERIERNATYHAPKDDQPARYVEMRNALKVMMYAVCENTPPSREQSLALTALEEASMWANAAIARNE